MYSVDLSGWNNCNQLLLKDITIHSRSNLYALSDDTVWRDSIGPKRVTHCCSTRRHQYKTWEVQGKWLVRQVTFWLPLEPLHGHSKCCGHRRSFALQTCKRLLLWLLSTSGHRRGTAQSLASLCCLIDAANWILSSPSVGVVYYTGKSSKHFIV